MRVTTWLARVLATALTLSSFAFAVPSQKYAWKNVKIGGGGGFVPGIVFNAKEKVCWLRVTKPISVLTVT
jgi:hypothetical protein